MNEVEFVSIKGKTIYLTYSNGKKDKTTFDTTNMTDEQVLDALAVDFILADECAVERW